MEQRLNSAGLQLAVANNSIVFALLTIVLLCPQLTCWAGSEASGYLVAAEGQATREEALTSERYGRGWALIFPGLGHVAEERVLAGSAWCGLGLVTLSFAGYADRNGDVAYDRYRRARLPGDASKYRRETEQWDRVRTASLIGFSGVWLLSVWDAYRVPSQAMGTNWAQLRVDWDRNICQPCLTLRIRL